MDLRDYLLCLHLDWVELKIDRNQLGALPQKPRDRVEHVPGQVQLKKILGHLEKWLEYLSDLVAHKVQLHKRGGNAELGRDIVDQVIVEIDLLQFEAVKEAIGKHLD